MKHIVLTRRIWEINWEEPKAVSDATGTDEVDLLILSKRWVDEWILNNSLMQNKSKWESTQSGKRECAKSQNWNLPMSGNCWTVAVKRDLLLATVTSLADHMTPEAYM